MVNSYSWVIQGITRINTQEKKLLTRLGQHSIINECVGQRWKQFRAFSSAGRAPALQAGGHRFKSYCDHHSSGGVAQLVRAPACHAGGREFEPRHSRHNKIINKHRIERIFKSYLKNPLFFTHFLIKNQGYLIPDS